METGYLEIEVTGIAHGGEGVGHLNGRVVFVAGALPGDRVRAQIIQDKTRYLNTRLVTILRAGPHRRDSPCAWSSSCGGCPLICLLEPAQLPIKMQVVIDQLQRIGRFSSVNVEAIHASPRSSGYRNRLRLYAIGGRVGFHQSRSDQLSDIPACFVARPSLNRLLDSVRNFLKPHFPLPAPLQIEMAEGATGDIVLAITGKNAQTFARFTPPFPIKTVLDASPLEHSPRPRLPFMQANPEQNDHLIDAVQQELQVQPSSRLLDLFCGNGNLTQMIADRVRSLVGIDSNPLAIDWAKRNAAPNSSYHCSDCESFVEAGVAAGATFERIVLDPPRAGARTLCQKLVALRPERIVYVSCDPATLARDLRILADAGYCVEKVRPFDMMPQTAEVECIASLSRI